jgi:hypothetical protein
MGIRGQEQSLVASLALIPPSACKGSFCRFMERIDFTAGCAIAPAPARRTKIVLDLHSSRYYYSWKFARVRKRVLFSRLLVLPCP